MNERIKQLEKLAYSEFLHERGGSYMAFDLYKFAELIVHECANVCFRIDEEYDGEDVLATWCGDGILKHFGVK